MFVSCKQLLPGVATTPHKGGWNKWNQNEKERKRKKAAGVQIKSWQFAHMVLVSKGSIR